MDKKFRDKIGNLKRMILTVRMSQTPLELNYNGRVSTNSSQVRVCVKSSSFEDLVANRISVFRSIVDEKQ